MSNKDKDGWIIHRGGKCPVEAGTLVDVKFRDGYISCGQPALINGYPDCGWAKDWSHSDQPGDIMAWRPHKFEQKSLSSVAADGELWSDDKEIRAAEAFAGPTQRRDRIHEIDAASKEEEARLIAAAPELLEELVDADAQMQKAYECVETGRYYEALLHLASMSRSRREVIAKARGEA